METDLRFRRGCDNESRTGSSGMVVVVVPVLAALLVVVPVTQGLDLVLGLSGRGLVVVLLLAAPNHLPTTTA